MNHKIMLAAGLVSSLYLSLSSPASAQSWEVYNTKLELQSRLIYDQIDLLSETVKIGNVDGKISLLSRDFKPAVSLIGNEVYQYLEPWIIVKGPSGIGAFHEYGQQVLPLEYDEIKTYFNFLVARKGKEYWIFERGRNKTTELGELDEATITHTGMLITRKGNEYFLPLTDNPEKSFELLSASDGDFLLAKEATGYGLINREGTYVMDPVLDQLEHTRGNFYFGHDESQYLLIEGGDMKANVRYNSFHKITYENGLMLEYIHGKLRRVMEEDGILLDAVGMEEVKMIDRDLYNIRFRDGKIGLLGKKGWLVKPMAEASEIRFGSEGLFPASSQGTFGFVNAEGEWVIPSQFSETTLFAEKLAGYKTSGQWGIVNSGGVLVSTPDWDEIKPFEKGKAIAKRADKFHLIGSSGEKLSSGFDHISRTKDGFFLVENDGKSGLLDTEGNEVLPLEFERINREKKDFVIVRKEGKTGVIKDSGEVIFPLDYQDILVDWENGHILTKNLYEPVVVQEIDTKGRKNKKGA